MDSDYPDEDDFLIPPGQLEKAELDEEVVMQPEDEEVNMPASQIESVKNRHELKLMQIDGVMGVGIGQNDIGDDAITVYLRSATDKAKIPTELDGYPVTTEITGEIDAQQN